MSALRALVIVGSMLAGAAPASAQSPCFAITSPGARLECYDRAARAPQPTFAPPPVGPADLSNVCTLRSPCVGPRGGVYYITPSGHRRYLPRG